MKVLSIGNSFSQNAHGYLHEIAKANGEDLTNVNLYIGGCSLRTHYLNMLDDLRAYDYEFNGQRTGLKVSIREGLISNEWDIVTLQQVSSLSFKEDSYFPYIQELVKYIKMYSPKTKVYLHQTWAYPAERERLKEVGFETTEDMFAEIHKAYDKTAESIHADGMIHSGEIMLKAYQIKKEKVYSDAIHAGSGFGQYLLGIIWFSELFGRKNLFHHISEVDSLISEEDKKLIDDLFKMVK